MAGGIALPGTGAEGGSTAVVNVQPGRSEGDASKGADAQKADRPSVAGAVLSHDVMPTLQ